MHRDRQRSPSNISTRIQIEKGVLMNTYPISLLLIRVCPRSKFLDVQEKAHAISYLIDTHLLQHSLIHLQQILSIDIVFSKQLLILSAVDTD